MSDEKASWSVNGALITHKGHVYDHNEDACLLKEVYSGEGMDSPKPVSFKTDGILIGAVSDGIGGGEAGEVASSMVVDSLAGFSPQGQEELVEHLCNLNQRVQDKGSSEDKLRGMGATVAGLCFGGEETFAFNVGDARVYRRQDDYLKQITKDDSIAQVLVDAGELAPDETRDKKLHQITQAIGGSVEHKDIEPHVYPLKINKQASFLICSDGLHDMVSIDDMEQIMVKAGSAMERVDNLFRAALESGGEDNITIIWIEMEPGTLSNE